MWPFEPPPLKTLAQKAAQWKMKPKQLRDYLLRIGLEESEIRAAFLPHAWQKIGDDALSRALKNAKRALGPADAAWLVHHMSVSITNSTVVNCHTWTSEHRYPIHFYAGFAFVVNKLARVFASEILKDVDPPLPDSIADARDLMKAIYEGEHLQKAWSVASLGGTQRQKLLAAQLAMSIEDAAIGHEIGHVFLLAGRDQETTDEVYAAFPAEQQQRGWAGEHYADLISARLLPKPSIASELAGIHGLAILLLLLVAIERRLGFEKTTSDHPPAFDRLAFVAGFQSDVIQHDIVKQCAAICGQI